MWKKNKRRRVPLGSKRGKKEYNEGSGINATMGEQEVRREGKICWRLRSG